MTRFGTFDDIPAIVALGRAMHAESRFRTISFDESKLARVLALLMADGGCVLVAERDGVLIGAFLGAVSEFYFSREQEASDLALFVHPQHRGGMAGPALLRAFIAWAKARGVRHLGVAISTGVMIEETGALFERLGFQRVGAAFAMEIVERIPA